MNIFWQRNLLLNKTICSVFPLLPSRSHPPSLLQPISLQMESSANSVRAVAIPTAIISIQRHVPARWEEWMKSVCFRPVISVRSASTRPVISTTLPRNPLHSAALPNITGRPMSEWLLLLPRLTATLLLLTFNGIFVKEEFLVQIVQYHFVIVF